MSKNKKGIIHPNVALTASESAFIQENRTHSAVSVPSGAEVPLAPEVNKKRKARPRNFSVYDDFYDDLTNFLAEFPSEGNKSSLITRVVTAYMERKRQEKRKRSTH